MKIMNPFLKLFQSFTLMTSLLVGVGLAMPVFAQADTANIPNAQALHVKAVDYGKDAMAGDLKSAFSMFPPRVFAEDAKKHGATVQQGIDLMAKEIGEQMAKQVKMISYAIDDAHPRTVALQDGKTGWLLPAEAVQLLLEKNKKVQFKFEVVAIYENATWYLMPLAQPWAYPALIEAYPEYRSIKIEKSATELKE